jgi:hypothetical protein
MFAQSQQFFVNFPLDFKEIDEQALDFALHLSRHFSVSVSLDFSIGRIFALLHWKQSISFLIFCLNEIKDWPRKSATCSIGMCTHIQ